MMRAKELEQIKEIYANKDLTKEERIIEVIIVLCGDGSKCSK
jgi:hypothetical protein